MLLRRPAPAESQPLQLGEIATPSARADEIVIQVSVCGVCRTDLDVAEGRITAKHYPIVPGHQVVGRVAEVGRAVTSWRVGERAGVAWIHSACGNCRWCHGGLENLCQEFESTGADANGGYAEHIAVRAEFAHAVPDTFGDAEAAPLLCAGAVGWRALRLANLADGEKLALVGFGASGHLVLQLSRHRHPRSPVYVFARNAEERAFAEELGAAWTGDTVTSPPDRLDAIIDTTPAWKPVVEALGHLQPGGRLVINAIRKLDADKSELMRLDYAVHLWKERRVISVANVTRTDVREALAAAARASIRPTVQLLPLRDANAALTRLQTAKALRGAMALQVR